MNDKETIVKKINESIEQLRPFLHADGGDMEFVDLTEDLIVQVRLLGSCSDCSMSHMTMRVGLEEALKKVAPEVQSVQAVD
jgi:Fe-S cluster biogenesis protein NfuA